ncbi:hypothetical protein [Nocardioides sp.]|uniref:hypothetical protein n=1 Tax=Nocardioides sp. TaxID=35761 RepID=UPI002ED2E098
MAEEKLGPMPEPEAEAPELHPGGTDAIVDDTEYPEGDVVVARDVRLKPEVDEQVPEEISEPDDKQQEPNGDSGTGETAEEPPA